MSTKQETRVRTGVFRRLRSRSSGKANRLMTPWQTFFYGTANVLLRFAFRLLANVEVVGVENVPRQGRLIVIGNHTSWLDPLFVGCFIPRPIVMMSKKENLSNPIGRFFVLSYGCFSVDRGNVDRSALSRIDEVMAAEGALGMFPEGHRSRTGELRRAKAGTALVAVRNNAPILPVSIGGAYKGLFSQLAHLHRPHFRVVIGEPFTLSQVEGDAVSRETLVRLTDELMWPVARNLPKEQQGYYSRHPES